MCGGRSRCSTGRRLRAMEAGGPKVASPEPSGADGGLDNSGASATLHHAGFRLASCGTYAPFGQPGFQVRLDIGPSDSQV